MKRKWNKISVESSSKLQIMTYLFCNIITDILISCKIFFIIDKFKFKYVYLRIIFIYMYTLKSVYYLSGINLCRHFPKAGSGHSCVVDNFVIVLWAYRIFSQCLLLTNTLRMFFLILFIYIFLLFSFILYLFIFCFKCL